jgi:hypothetical protein
VRRRRTGGLLAAVRQGREVEIERLEVGTKALDVCGMLDMVERLPRE